MTVHTPVRWLLGAAVLIVAAPGVDASAEKLGLLRPVQLTRGYTVARVPEGRFATARGTYYDADLRDVELSVSLGELDLVPPRPRPGYFYDELRRLNLGAQTSASRSIYGLGDLDGDADVDIFVPRQPGPHVAFLNDGSGNFTRKFSVSGGDARPNRLRLADLDLDGDLDALLLVVDTGFFGGEVWINDGSASFTREATFPLQPGGVFGEVLGDLDGDGDPDLMLSLGSISDETVTRINDQLDFDNPGPALPFRSRDAALGDLDGDGDVDAVLIDLDSATLWKNEGGDFTPFGPPIDSSVLVAVALGDLDLDGDVDIVLGHQDRWARVLLNDGTGGFGEEKTVHARDSETVDLIDLDGDGDLDLGLPRSVWINDGTGTFTDTEQSLPTGKYGDITGDFAPELLVGEEGEVWRNGLQLGRWNWSYEAPDGPYEETIELTATSLGEAPVRIAWPMVLRNALPEAIAAENQFTDTASAAIRLGSFRDAGDDGPWQVEVDWGDGTREMFEISTAGDLGTRMHAFPGRGAYAIEFRVSEESGETGAADSLTVHVGSGKLRLLQGGGPLVSADEGGVATTTGAVLASAAGALSLEASRGSIELVEGPGSTDYLVPTGQTPGPGSRLLGDLDGDGDLDGFAGERVWLNRGDGIFEPTNQTLPSVSGYGVRESRLADLDGDGDLDALVSIPSDASYSLRNDGSGYFTEAQSLRISYQEFASGIALGDVNGDGFVDVVRAAYLDEYPIPSAVYFNRGDGTFFSSSQSLPGAHEIALGDVDGDGDLDAFVAGNTHAGFNNGVCFNDGDGYFSRCDAIIVSTGAATSVALGDLDADGDLDAFVGFTSRGAYLGDASERPDRVFLNDGAGLFTETEQRLGNSGTGSVTLGDLDGDGDLDAWLYSPQTVWLNDGSGHFEDAGLTFDTGESALGDLDGDGKLDVFTDQVYLNRTPQASFTWTEPVDDGPRLFDVSLTASLGDREVSDAFQVSVLNLPPTATLELVSAPHCAQPLRFVADFQGDPSPVDEQAGFTTFFHVTPPDSNNPYQTRVGPDDPPAGSAELIVPAEQSRSGSWRVFARVFDKDRGEARLELRSVIVDPLPPTGEIVAPEPGSCHGPADVPLAIEDDFRDACDASVARQLSPAGPFMDHGNYSVTLQAADLSGNVATDSVAFTIDQVLPQAAIVEPLSSTVLPDDLPLGLSVAATDDDGADGGVQHEAVHLSGCPLYDGLSFGDGDGLLSDETLVLDRDTLCNAIQSCALESGPQVLQFVASDCAGNEGQDHRALQLDAVASCQPVRKRRTGGKPGVR